MFLYTNSVGGGASGGAGGGVSGSARLAPC